MKKQEGFALVWVYCGTAKEIFTNLSVRICQLEKKKLILQPQYKKGKLQIRRKGAIKFKAALNEK